MLWSVLTYIRAGKRLGDGLTASPQGSLLGHRNLQGEIRNILCILQIRRKKRKTKQQGALQGDACLHPPTDIDFKIQIKGN